MDDTFTTKTAKITSSKNCTYTVYVCMCVLVYVCMCVLHVHVTGLQ